MTDAAERWVIDAFGVHTMRGRHYLVWINARPSYCDRGNWLAHLDPLPGADRLAIDLDSQDGWPRYYFDLDRAKAECVAWLAKRGEI